MSNPIEPGSHGKISLSGMKPKSWQASCWARDLSGVKTRVRRSGATKLEARRELERALSPYLATGVETVNDLLVTWLNTNLRLSDATRVRYGRQLCSHVCPRIGGLHISRVTEMDLQGVVDAIQAEIGLETAQQICRRLRASFKWGARAGIRSDNPAAGLKMPSPVRSADPGRPNANGAGSRT